MGRGARQAGKSKSHAKSTRDVRRKIGGGFAQISPEFLMGSRGFSLPSAPQPAAAPAEPAVPARKVPTEAAKARHQRKKHNRWERRRSEWEAQQKAIDKKKAPKTLAVPRAAAEAADAPGGEPVPAKSAPPQPPPQQPQPPPPPQQPGGAPPKQLSASKLAKAARRQQVRKEKRRAAAVAEGGAGGAAAAGGPDAADRLALLAEGGGELTLAMGVRALDLSVGSGPEVQERKTVRVKYVGRLGSSTGTVFDRGTIGFRLGKGEVIKGWDVGVRGMRAGGRRRLTVPPKAGYGAQRSGSIPPNSTLVFDVTVEG